MDRSAKLYNRAQSFNLFMGTLGVYGETFTSLIKDFKWFRSE